MKPSPSGPTVIEVSPTAVLAVSKTVFVALEQGLVRAVRHLEVAGNVVERADEPEAVRADRGRAVRARTGGEDVVRRAGEIRAVGDHERAAVGLRADQRKPVGA